MRQDNDHKHVSESVTNLVTFSGDFSDFLREPQKPKSSTVTVFTAKYSNLLRKLPMSLLTEKLAAPVLLLSDSSIGFFMRVFPLVGAPRQKLLLLC